MTFWLPATEVDFDEAKETELLNRKQQVEKVVEQLQVHGETAAGNHPTPQRWACRNFCPPEWNFRLPSLCACACVCVLVCHCVCACVRVCLLCTG